MGVNERGVSPFGSRMPKLKKRDEVNSKTGSTLLGSAGMESTISTKDLKTKLDKKQITVVETLAPERYHEAHIAGALNIPPEKIRELAPKL
jgi:hypothetical protein